jgi:RHS repeat-associated protein
VFYNPTWQALETRESTGSAQAAESVQPQYQYVWSKRYIDALVCRDENTDQDGECDDCRLYYLSDANMNVTCIVDTSGAAEERYAYDPYGRPTVLDGSTRSQTEWSVDADQSSDVDNLVLYCGYCSDPETGDYCVRHRVLNPAVGGWGQRDPARYADGMNLYQYAKSSPLVNQDPSGEIVTSPPAGTSIFLRTRAAAINLSNAREAYAMCMVQAAADGNCCGKTWVGGKTFHGAISVGMFFLETFDWILYCTCDAEGNAYASIFSGAQKKMILWKEH